MTVLIMGEKFLSSRILLYPSMTEQHTSLILTAFFLFFYNSYLALLEIFFMALVLSKVLTIELILFCGRSFMIYCFFCCFDAYYSSVGYWWLYWRYCFYCYCSGECFLPWRGSIDLISVVINVRTLKIDDIFVGEVERRGVIWCVVWLLSGFAQFTCCVMVLSWGCVHLVICEWYFMYCR